MLDVLGEVCGERVAPRAAEADEEGAHYESGEVTYAAATRDAIEALRQAELFGAMLSREYGGLNLPESVYQMMVEIVARAESGLMTVYGLQEIASSIEEYGDPETKARVLPRFARGEVSGAMVLTEADAGSDLGAVATRATLDEVTGQWHLNGVKRFITNGLADVSLVLARSEEGSADARGLSLFLVERDATVKIRRIENKLGIHASPTCEIQYTEHAGRPHRQAPLRTHPLLDEPDERRSSRGGRTGPRHRRSRVPRGRPVRSRARPVRQADPEPAGGGPAAALDESRSGGHARLPLRDRALGGSLEGL